MRIDKRGQLELRQQGNYFVMTGGKFGQHAICESEYNERVKAHWVGYCKINIRRG